MRCKRRQEHNQRLKNLALVAFQFIQFVHGNHECAHGSVEREGLYIRADFSYQLVQGLQFFCGSLALRNDEAVTVIEHPPYPLEEAVHAVNALGIPWLGLLKRPEEHLIKPEGISSVSIAYHIRVHDIIHGLGHLLHCPAAHIFPVLEYEFGISKIRHPFTEGIHVKPVIMHNVHIHMYRCRLIIVLEPERNKGVGIYDAIYEI